MGCVMYVRELDSNGFRKSAKKNQRFANLISHAYFAGACTVIRAIRALPSSGAAPQGLQAPASPVSAASVLPGDERRTGQGMCAQMLVVLSISAVQKKDPYANKTWKTCSSDPIGASYRKTPSLYFCVSYTA